MPPPVDPSYLSGKDVAVIVNGVYMFAMGGNVERSVNVIRVNNSREGCFQVVAPGIKGGRGTLRMIYKGTEPPPVFEVGDYIELVVDCAGSECTLEETVGRVLTMPAMITTLSDTWDHGADYTWSLGYETSGAWSIVEPTPVGGTV